MGIIGQVYELCGCEDVTSRTLTISLNNLDYLSYDK